MNHDDTAGESRPTPSPAAVLYFPPLPPPLCICLSKDAIGLPEMVGGWSGGAGGRTDGRADGLRRSSGP